ncbi:MAG: arylsulfotransferase family protein [Alphaproteobacteria bacterium]
MFGRYIWIIYGLCLVLLAFVAGVAATHYKFSAGILVQDALKSGQQWYTLYREDVEYTRHEKTHAPEPLIEWNKNKAFYGYTLLTTHNGNSVWLVNMIGKTIHSWHASFWRIWPNAEHLPVRPRSAFVHKLQLFPNGDLLVQFSSIGITPYGLGIAKLDKDSNILWRYTEFAHHDFHVDKENGHIYALTQEMIHKAPQGYEQLPFPMLADYIVTLSPDGREIRRLSILKAFKNSSYYPMLHYYNGKEKWDHLHTNSVEKLEPDMAQHFPMFKKGQLLVSVRNPSIIAVIDTEKEAVVWAAKGIWLRQHAAQFTRDGTITFLDNQGMRTADSIYSRILAINPATRDTTILYAPSKERFFTRYMGSHQMLDNGNIFINSANQSRLFEVNNSGEIVWRYQLPVKTSNRITGAARYTREYVDFLNP